MRTRHVIILSGLAISAGLSGCRAAPAPEAGPPAAPATASPAPEAGSAFTPPADGRLTEAQVETYIAVRQRVLAEVEAEDSAKGAPAGSAGPRLARLAGAEEAAAAALGHSVDEYRWVRDRVAEASAPPGAAEEGAGGVLAAAGRSGARLQQEVAPPATTSPPAAVPESEARAYNRRLLERFRPRLEKLKLQGAFAPAGARSPSGG